MIPMGADRVVSPGSSHIIGEDATVFTDMTDTMLKVFRSMNGFNSSGMGT